MSIFSIGVGGLNAAQMGIMTSGHNISNASTPGYSRQSISQGTNNAILTGSGFVGQGVHVQTVKRTYDEYMAKQVLHAEAGASEMDSYTTQISQIDNLLADASSGLSPALAGFFKGVQDVAANPSSIPGRQSMLSASSLLTERFHALDDKMTEVRLGVNSYIANYTKEINVYASQLADINQRIMIARTGISTQAPNDLLDKRDQMIKELNQLVRVTTVVQGEEVNVFFGKGQPLVVGTQYNTLVAMVSPEDQEKFVVGMIGEGSLPIAVPESQVSGGKLGGILAFRSQTLDKAQNYLGRVAVTIAQNFNDQHNLGMDLTGALGGDYFKVPPPNLKQNASNTGSGAPILAFDTANMAYLSGSDYRLSFRAGQFQLLRLSDAQAQTFASLPQTVDGIQIDLGDWVPNENDSFLIEPTRTGARNLGILLSDTRSIAAAAPIRTSTALINSGTGAIDAGVVVDTANPSFANFNTTGQIAPPVLIQFDHPPTSYSLYDTTDPTSPVLIQGNIAYTAGADVFPTASGLDYGYRVKISGVPASGDQFSVGGDITGIADNRNAMLLGALQTKSTMNASVNVGPTASYQSAYSQIVSFVGSKSSEVQAIGASQQTLADQSNSILQQVAGVNLDEEAANLLRYQQAYQASAKILSIATKIFDEILSLGR